MEYKGLTLDKFQEDSIKSIDNNHSVVVSAPTGSGKTLIADYIINKYIKKGVKVIYTAPIKALSNQKYKEFSEEYGKEAVGLLTGDVSINPQGDVVIMTTEVYRNMALTKDAMIDTVSYVVFDEIHFINDIERGYIWEESIIFSKPNVRFLCLSATIPNAEEFASWIKSIKKHNVDTIKHDKRNVPLYKKFYDSELGITTLEDIRDVKDIPDYNYIKSRRRKPRIRPPNHVELLKEIKDKVPCFFFNFSRQGCQDCAMELARARIFPHDSNIGLIIRDKLRGAPPEIGNLKSTRILRQTLPNGVGFHHAGLLPIIKELVEDLFSKGLIKVLYTTETFAVGINMPAKTVCFKSLRKFDGANFRFLNSKEYFQIAGRAGRRGIDKEGFVYSMVDRRDFDYQKLKRITGADIEPIKSQFRLSVNTILNLIKAHTKEEIEIILKMSFYTYQRGSKAVIKNVFINTTKKLVKLGYVKDGKLTSKGEFSSKIYADEILTGEIFATNFYKGLTEYQFLLIIASLSYEPRERTEFFKKYPSSSLNELKKKIRNSEEVKNKRFNHLDSLTALIHPLFQGENVFEIMKNTNFLEGDVIRFFRQMLDRFSQIREAAEVEDLRQIVRNCQDIINDSLSLIDAV